MDEPPRTACIRGATSHLAGLVLLILVLRAFSSSGCTGLTGALGADLTDVDVKIA
ncbi:hypothetical protein ACGFW5_25855 [Streptomyces sp. NPDC048416]|uniref:hypothetical protein n=1 Tax=Streptomyces sp. NPDC048416 TaxID=3365546 RepID=UPI00371D4940